MKRCPQCQTLYEDATQFCLNDGQLLIADAPSNADSEEDTVIRHDPIIVDFNQPTAPPETIAYQTAPPGIQPTIIVEKQRNTGKYLLFLVIGLLLGGGLVLATLLIAGSFNRDRTENSSNMGGNRAERIVTTSQNSNNTNNVASTPSNANLIESNRTHAEKTGATDDEFNGRVITLNAYVRSAPSKSAAEVSILPKDDRIKIGERENANSPWYRVTCEHGTAGWMHGDTIEFTNQ